MATINQTLDMGRFGCLFRKYFIENWRRVSMQFLGLTAIMILVLLFIEHQQYAAPSGELFVVMAVIVYIYGMVIASDAFRQLGRPTSALSTLMCPASQFEGFLMRWIIAVPLFLLWAWISAFAADLVRVVYADFINHPGDFADWGMLFTTDDYDIGASDPFNNMFSSFLVDFLVVQSFFLLGSAVWQKNAIIKTIIAISVIWMSYVAVTLGFIAAFADDMYYVKNEYFGLITAVVRCCIILFNYLLTYMRYREAEIINRW